MSGKIILTNRDLLEQLNLVAPKESYTLQEGTERLLYFGALLRTRLLDTFGNLLYIYYDDFSIAEVQALHKVYQEIFGRRYDIFNLVPVILRNPDTRPSKICARIYTHAELCLKSSASICRRIRPQHDLPHPDDLSTPALNVTHLAYRLSKISRQYLGGFSLAALLKLLQQEVLTITPDLLSGLLYNVRYDHFDDDVRLAERELVQSFRKIAHTTEISIPLPTAEKFRTVNSFLKYYVNIYAEKLSDDNLKRHAFLIVKRIVDDIGTIDENIYLLGNVYENRTIHIKYLFDLVLPDDLLDNDVIEAKKYLVKKLNEFDVVEKYLRVQKYQQATPVQLTMEITGQLKDIDFAKSIAISLRIHARFWRSNHMIESLGELLELFDAYENLRQVPLYDDLMKKIDSIKENLWDMKDIPVEILCNAPRACLQIGLQSVLYCKYVSFEIKELIREFFKLSNMCVIPIYVTQESRRTVDIPFKISKTRFSKIANLGAIWNTERKIMKIKPTSETAIRVSTETFRESSETSEKTIEISNETDETDETDETVEVSTETEERITEFMNTTTTPVTTEHVSTTTIIDKTSPIQEETTTTATSTTAATTTVSPTTTTLPTTITTLPAIITMLPSTTTLPTTTTTIMPTVTTTTTTSPTTTTILPTTTTTSSTTITTTSPATTTTTLPTTTTTLPTTTTTTSPTTTSTILPTTITTILPTTTTTTSPTTTTTLPTTTITTLPTTITTIGPTTTTTLPTTIITSTLFTTDTTTARTMIPIDMKWIKKKKKIFALDIYKETTQSSISTSTKPCESNECEQSSEKTTTQPSTLKFIQTSPESSTAITETTVIEELSETPVTKGR